MWSFVPRIPTRTAYAMRLFKDKIHSIEELLKELKGARIEIRGQVIFDTPCAADTFGKAYFKYMDGKSLMVSFNNPTELESILFTYTAKGHSPKQISFHQYGTRR